MAFKPSSLSPHRSRPLPCVFAVFLFGCDSRTPRLSIAGRCATVLVLHKVAFAVDQPDVIAHRRLRHVVALRIELDRKLAEGRHAWSSHLAAIGALVALSVGPVTALVEEVSQS